MSPAAVRVIKLDGTIVDKEPQPVRCPPIRVYSVGDRKQLPLKVLVPPWLR